MTATNRDWTNYGKCGIIVMVIKFSVQKEFIYMAAKKKKGNTKPNTRKKAAAPASETSEQAALLTSPVFLHGAVLAILFAATLLFMFLDSDSVLASGAHKLFGGLFGVLAYMMPLLFGGNLLYLVYFRSIPKLWIKIGLCLSETVTTAAIIELFSGHSPQEAFNICGQNISGGGYLGAVAATSVKNFAGIVGAFALFIVLFITLGCLISHFNIIPYIIGGIKRMCGISSNVGNKVRERRAEREAERNRLRDYDDYEPKQQDIAPTKRLKHIDTGEDLPLPESPIEKRQRRDGDRQQRKRTGNATIDIANDFATDLKEGTDKIPNLFDDPVSEQELYNMEFRLPGEEEPPEPEKAKTKVKVKLKRPAVKTEAAAGNTEPEPYEDFEINEMAASGEKPDKPREKNLTATEKAEYNAELDDAASAETAPYEFPPLDLLDKPKATSADKRHELYEKAQQLISVLDNFGVKAKPVQVTQGPTVTRFEIQPQSGIKLSKIVGLADDIALNLAVSTVLIAPVPGKAATVGVEIPNTNVTPVKIREILESPEFRNAKSKLTVGLGKDIGGNVVVGDIAKWPHALIAGATGSGKSVCINTIITSILYKADPNEVKMIMVDPKQVELGVYNGIPHLLIPVVTEAKKAAGALNWAVQEMMQRYDKFKNAGVRKLDVYNKLMEKTGGEKLPQIVIIIDELADLMMVAAKEVEDYICRLAQLARAAGIHLIIATQRPSVDVITGLIKANVPSRIAFFVSSQVDSRTILDKAGAEKLLGRGDMLYFPAGARSTTRVQGAMVTDDDDGEVARIVGFIKNTSPETHYSEDLADHIERVQLGENGVTPDSEDDGDALLNDAIRLAVELGKISTSMVQRRLSVGYSRAGRIIDQMEARGIISPANGAKPRDVLVSYADLDDIKNAAENAGNDYEDE